MNDTLGGPTQDPWTYPLITHAGHLLIEAHGQRYFIDTGSPVSLGDTPIRLADAEIPDPSAGLGPMTVMSLVEMVGTPFDALIVTDLLALFDVEIALHARTFTLSEALFDLSAGFPVDYVNRTPRITCEIDGREAHCFIDTGAPLSYIGDAWLEGAAALEDYDDFHPMFGEFRVPTYATTLRCLGSTLSLRVGRMPELLAHAVDLGGGDGIVGTRLFEQGVFRWSQRQGRAMLTAN